jgi:hypothetical protein
MASDLLGLIGITRWKNLLLERNIDYHNMLTDHAQLTMSDRDMQNNLQLTERSLP